MSYNLSLFYSQAQSHLVAAIERAETLRKEGVNALKAKDELQAELDKEKEARQKAQA